MKLVDSRARNTFNAVLFCALSSALLSVSSPSNAASRTLTISGSPPTTVTVGGNRYWFAPTARDTINSRIGFVVYNKPTWLQFDNKTGHLWGSPLAADVGTYRNITIRAIDSEGSVTTPPFSITVINAQASKPPVAPPPVAKAPVPPPPVSKPPVAPPVVSTPPVATPPVTTPPVATANNALLDWTPPTENNDGSVLTDLAGYKVHYGTSPDQLTQVINLPNPGLTSYVVDNLTAGTWYFAVTSYATGGVESQQSGIVSAKIL
jgi:Putative Ig domain/Fibronectin type III domain